MIINFESYGIEDYGYLVVALEQNEYRSKLKKLELDMKHCESAPVKQSIKKSKKLDLNSLPHHMRYVLRYDTLPVINTADLNGQQVECVVEVLKWFKKAIGWTTVDIIGILRRICPHKIQLMPNHKLCIEHQRRLNLPMQEVVEKEIIKLLDVRVIYPISQSSMVCPVQCVPKKGGITEVPN